MWPYLKDLGTTAEIDTTGQLNNGSDYNVKDMVSKMTDPKDKAFKWKSFVKKYRIKVNLSIYTNGLIVTRRITKSDTTCIWLLQQTNLAFR